MCSQRSSAVWLSACLSACLCAACLWPAAAAARSRLAFFDVIDRSGAVEAPLLDSLTRTLRAQARRSGRYSLLDKATQDGTLARLKRGKSCSDEARCALAAARELSARAMLVVTVTRAGADLALGAELLDPRNETALKAAQATAPASPAEGLEDRLLGAARALASELFGATDAGAAGAGSAGSAGSSELAERRREQREAAARQRSLNLAQRDVQRRRSTSLIYGISAAVSAAIMGGLGAVYLTKSVSDAEKKADQATSPSALQTAADEAASARTRGILMLSLAGAAAGVAAWLLLSMPSASAQVAGVSLDRLPAPAPVYGQTGGIGGLGLTWGGSF